MDQPDITLRSALPQDEVVIRNVAALDSSRHPGGDALVAVVGDRITAVITLHDGHVVADPFVPTAAAVELLRRRRAQLCGTAVRARRGVAA